MVTLNLLKKRCVTCKKEKVFTLFYGTKSHARGDGRASHCTACNRLNVRAWEAGNRTAANAMRVRHTKKLKAKIFAKFNNACACCGFDDVRALQLDHVNNDGAAERFPNGRSVGWSVSRVAILGKALKDTIGRYQLLCANCHAIKSYETNSMRLMAANGGAS